MTLPCLLQCNVNQTMALGIYIVILQPRHQCISKRLGVKIYENFMQYTYDIKWWWLQCRCQIKMCVTTVNKADEWSIHKFMDVSLRSLLNHFNKNFGLRYCHVDVIVWYTWINGMSLTGKFGHVWTKFEDCCGLFQQTIVVQIILVIPLPCVWIFLNILLSLQQSYS